MKQVFCFPFQLSRQPIYLLALCICALCVGTKMLKQRSSVLYLEDGSSFTGYGFGAAKDVSGEVGM